jgi:hypothetical protein
MVRAAVERGQLPVGTDPGALLTTVIAPLCLPLPVTAQGVDDRVADRRDLITRPRTTR